MEIIPVQSEELDVWREAIQWHFESFAERARGEITSSELFEEVSDKYRQLWVIRDKDEVAAVVLTRVIPHLVVEITHCAGKDRHGWKELLIQTIAGWCREQNIPRLRIIHRPGWGPWLREIGFESRHVVSEIEWTY